MPPLSPLLFRRVLVIVGLFILLLGSFALGITIGERKAKRFSHWCENYPRMVPGRPPVMDRKILFPTPALPSTHGVFGKILSFTANSVIVQGNDGREEHVRITPSTNMRLGREDLRFEQLPATLQGMEAAVFGFPAANGEMEARLIRLFPRH